MTRKNVLVVDDDRNIQAMLRLCLQADYDITLVGNGLEALEIIQRLHPDLMLLDLAMPVMDGMSLLTTLRDQPAMVLPRVVVMTAHGSVRTAVQAIRLGASDFLEKPFTPEDVRLSVASVLAEPDASAPAPPESYDAVLQSVRQSLRAGQLGQAESWLMQAGTIADADPVFFNLAGVVHEAHGRRHSARKFYERAIAEQPGYQPARRNLKRLEEIDRTGAASQAVCLGDDAAASVTSNKPSGD